jgi:hypothetical protein
VAVDAVLLAGVSGKGRSGASASARAIGAAEGGGGSVTDQQQDIARVAVGALLDLYARESDDLKAVRYLTRELELKGGKPAEARAWTERRVNLSRLLTSGGPKP